MRRRDLSVPVVTALVLVLLLQSAVMVAAQSGQEEQEQGGEGEADLMLRYPVQVTFTVWGEGRTYNEKRVEAAAGDALETRLFVRARGGENTLEQSRNYTVRAVLEAEGDEIHLASAPRILPAKESGPFELSLNLSLPGELVDGEHLIRFHLETGRWDPDPDNNDPSPVPLRIGRAEQTVKEYLFQPSLLVGPVAFAALLVTPWVVRGFQKNQNVVSLWRGTTGYFESWMDRFRRMEAIRRRRALSLAVAGLVLVAWVFAVAAIGRLVLSLQGVLDALTLAVLAGVAHLVGGTLGRSRQETQDLRLVGKDPHDPENRTPMQEHLRDATVSAGFTFLVLVVFALFWQQLAAATEFFRWPAFSSLHTYVVLGLSIGGIYALIALGYTMVYGILKFINFAHGEVFMWGAFFAWIFVAGPSGAGQLSSLLLLLVLVVLAARPLSRAADNMPRQGWQKWAARAGVLAGVLLVGYLFVFLLPGHLGPMTSFITSSVLFYLLLVLVVAAALTGLLGAVMEKVAYRPLRGGDRLAPLVTAIALALFLQATSQFFFSGRRQSYTGGGSIYAGSGLQAFFSRRLEILDVTVDYLALTVLVLSVLLMLGLHLFVRHTRLGQAMRAASDDLDTARTIGINVDRVITTTFVIGSVLAAVGGILFGLRFGLQPTMGLFMGIKAFTAAVVGGIGNIHGAFVGGFLIGLAENVGGRFIASQFQRVIAFAILIGFLLFRPQGIFGTGGERV